jgi:hypothetical protein
MGDIIGFALFVVLVFGIGRCTVETQNYDQLVKGVESGKAFTLKGKERTCYMTTQQQKVDDLLRQLEIEKKKILAEEGVEQ